MKNYIYSTLQISTREKRC